MSLNFIKPINTIISATEDEIWYSNPSINIELSSTGEVRDKLDNEHGFRSEICFMTLRKQLPEQVSKHQALKIQGALERYSDSVKALNESIVGLEVLLKQVK